MKKTYINPKMEVFEIEAPNLCTVSNNSASIYTSGSGVNAGDALGRDTEEEW